MPLSSNYNPKDNETQIYTQWMDAKIGHVPVPPSPLIGGVNTINQTPTRGATNGSGVKTHSILMPPPNLTGDLHAGHAFQHYLMDTLSRLARQRGEKNLWFPGVDHAGLQLEGVIDKLIKKGEFDDIINNFTLKNSSYLGGGSEADGGNLAVAVEQLMADNRNDLPKYLKTNCPDLWLECAWSKVNLWRDNQKNQSAILGDTPDYDRSLFTLDPQNLEMVNYAFLKYWQDGLIYKGSYLVNWSVGLQTALSDVAGEIEYEKRIDPFITFEYRLFSASNVAATTVSPLSGYASLNNSIQVGTVRPETIFGDYAVAIHPEVFEKQYSEYRELLNEKKLFVQIPLTDKMIPIILADEVDPDFGSGSLKITPANDIVDYEIFNKYIGGDFESAIGRDGKLTAICGEFAGQTVNEGRANVIKKLIENGFVPKKKITLENMPLSGAPQSGGVPDPKNYFGIEFAEGINPENYDTNWNYEHNVTICERTKTVVEPLISEEFFISYHKEFNWNPISKDSNKTIISKGKKTNLQKLGIDAVKATNFHSPEYKERGINFLENIKDWCISRDLIWGHKMPVWYNLDLNPDRIFYSFEGLQKENSPLEGWQAKPDGVDQSDALNNINMKLPTLENTHFAISVTKPTTTGNWVQEEKILDTWFSSCLWPLSTLKYPEFVRNNNEKLDQNDFTTFYPTQEMTTGKDIFYQWIVRMTTLSYYFTAQIPYENLVITPTILDDKGKKMSKALGNGMNPVGQIEKYSSDALRMSMLGNMIPDRNMKMGGRIADELCEKYRNFGNKMWNVARFFEYQEEKES
jgi:valyl-tRNA synthetase